MFCTISLPLFIEDWYSLPIYGLIQLYSYDLIEFQEFSFALYDLSGEIKIDVTIVNNEKWVHTQRV